VFVKELQNQGTQVSLLGLEIKGVRRTLDNLQTVFYSELG
jgi:hypothetical protein